MRILVISNLYPPFSIGGYEERCRQVIDRLRSRGHTVRVLTSTHGLNGEQMDNQIHRRLAIHGYFGHPWLPIQQLFFLEKHNHHVLREELAGFRPDLIHVWNLGGLSKSLILTLQAQDKPVVFDVSDHWIARSLKADVWLRWWNGDTGGSAAAWCRRVLRYSGLTFLIRRVAPFAPWNSIRFGRLYFTSNALKQLTISKGYALDHAAVIYCGIATANFRERLENPRFSRLLYVGRLSADKDPLTAIQALRLLPERFTLTMFGKGDDDYTKLLRDAAAGLDGRVEFKTATVDEMPGIYAQYDCLLFTSAWEEPFALTLLEAMASNIPVVSTLEGGSRELVRHGRNAMAFRTGNAEDLAAQVLCLESDPALRHAVTKTARKDVLENYDLEQITTQIEEFLKASCGISSKTGHEFGGGQKVPI